MSKISNCIEKYHLSINKIEKTSSYIILYGTENQYLIKEKDSSKKELWNDFKLINYSYYLPPINDASDPYELYYYYEDNTKDKELKGQKIIDALIELHRKTMVEEELPKNVIEDIYERIKKELEEIESYYEQLQDRIESMSYPRVDYYNLLINVTQFYRSIWYSKKLLEDWHQLNTHKMNQSFVIHDASLKNFRISNNSYFININNNYKDYRIYDLLSFYKENLLELSMPFLLEKYMNKCPLTESEQYLFNCLIGIPDKIVFTSDVYQNTINIKEALKKLNKTFLLWSEKNEKNQETNKEELKE